MPLNVVVCLSNVGIALVTLALAVPLIRRRIPMNHVYGVRFARSFESDELWYRINEYGGRRMVLWSGVLALIGLASLPVSSEPWLVALACAPVVYLVPCVESYRFAQRL